MTVALSKQAVKPDCFPSPRTPRTVAELLLRRAQAIREYGCRGAHRVPHDSGCREGPCHLARKLESLPAVAEAFGRARSRVRTPSCRQRIHSRTADEITNLESAFVEAAKEHNPNGLAVVVQHATDAIRRRRRREQRRETLRSATGPPVEDIRRDGCSRRPLRPRRHRLLERSVRPRWNATGLPATGVRVHNAGGRVHEPHPARRRPRRARLREAVSRHFVVAVDVGDFYSPERIEELRLEVRRSGYLSAATLERIGCDARISRSSWPEERSSRRRRTTVPSPRLSGPRSSPRRTPTRRRDHIHKRADQYAGHSLPRRPISDLR